MARKLKHFWGTLGGYVAALSFRLNLCRAVSYLQRLRESEYKDIPPPLVQDFEEVLEHTKTFRWESDRTRLIDSISYVGRIIKTKKDDCDGFALFNALSVERSLDEGFWEPKGDDDHWTGNIAETALLAVIYQKPSGRVEGHMVALFRSISPEYNRSSFQWMDYSWPVSVVYDNETEEFREIRSVSEAAQSVATRMGGDRLLAYAVIDPHTLTVIGYERI